MISVAMAVYNGSRYIKQQLESIRDQTLAPDEVIICDDRSGDDTADIVRQFITSSHLEDTWKLYINETNLGFVNKLFSAGGKTVCFLPVGTGSWIPVLWADGLRVTVSAKRKR